MTSDEMFAKHGLVLVLAADVRKMMDFYQSDHFKDEDSDDSYTRLWNALHFVGLDRE